MQGQADSSALLILSLWEVSQSGLIILYGARPICLEASIWEKGNVVGNFWTTLRLICCLWGHVYHFCLPVYGYMRYLVETSLVCNGDSDGTWVTFPIGLVLHMAGLSLGFSLLG